MLVRIKFAAICALLSVATLLHAEPISSLKPINYVSDFAGVLNSATQSQLNDLCRQIDQKAHAQIAIVTVKSTDGDDIVSYAVALYQAWGIGPKSSDRGVLVLIAVQDRKYWAAVGYGLEPILPDGKVGGFGREAVPLLRNEDFNGAATLFASRVANVIAQDAGITLTGTPAVAPPAPGPNIVVSPGGKLFGLIVIIVVFLLLLSSGGRGFLFGLLWSMFLSGGGRGGGGGGGGFGGGFGGGGGGGFGGFGGGSTGGGGAGGSW